MAALATGGSGFFPGSELKVHAVSHINKLVYGVRMKFSYAWLPTVYHVNKL